MKERLQAKKAQIQANRQAVTKLKSTITGIAKELALDEERIQKRVDAALTSEYGPINGLINLVAAIAHWPAEQGDGAMVATNRNILENKFKLDLIMLSDIRRFRGFHSFVTEDLTVMDGQEPQYEDYTDYCMIFLEELGVEAHRPTIDEASWKRAEAKAVERASVDLELMKAEVEAHKAFIASRQK